jgi:hypothetical protein
MREPTPAGAIFVEHAEGVFLVVNWHERAIRGGHARLLPLSARHLDGYLQLRARGRTHFGIYHLLFLPTVDIARILARTQGTAAGAAPPAAPGSPALPAGSLPAAAGPTCPGPAAEAVPPQAQIPRSLGAAALTVPTAAAQPPAADSSAPPVRGLRQAGTGWAISAAAHGLLLLAACWLCYAVHPASQPVPPLRSVAPEPQPPASVQVRTSTGEHSEDLPESLVTSVESPEQPVADRSDETDNVTIEVPTSRDPRPALASALDDSADGLSPAMLGVGGGTQGGGMLGPRGSLRRHAALRRYGGNAAGQSAVDAALRWFKRHQGPSGAWNPETYEKNCNDSPRCEPAAVLDGDHSFTCAMTGCALLCYLGAGYDHLAPSTYREVVRRGIGFLVQAQHQDGGFGNSNYSSAIATMALCEALSLSGDSHLRYAAQRGVDFLLRHQNVEDGSAARDGNAGWDYIGPSLRNDSSVTGWCVMALVSARTAHLEIGEALEHVTSWLDMTWMSANPQWQSCDAEQGVSDFPYAYVSAGHSTTGGTASAAMMDLAGVGAVAAAFLPHAHSDAELASLGRHVVAIHLPRNASFNRYYVYYGSLALFQQGGELWQAWNRATRDQLVDAQRHGPGCFAGSWDDGPGGFCRLFSTGLCCLSLEVYYRYERQRP